ncbi:MAG: hypothetical protein K1X71_09930 [Pirellulales bacterium]|nr:hypothetical protein [Pirellulales bacterium]
MPQITPIGKMTAFYIPSHKLDSPRYFRENSTRAHIHEFLIQHYKAYTQTPSPVKGYWISSGGELTHDVTERFEVSFEAESDFDKLIAFLAELCQALEEDTIYLTRGDESFLVSQ